MLLCDDCYRIRINGAKSNVSVTVQRLVILSVLPVVGEGAIRKTFGRA